MKGETNHIEMEILKSMETENGRCCNSRTIGKCLFGIIKGQNW